MTPLVAIVAALCVARLTRLVTEDRITEAPRDWLVRRSYASNGKRPKHADDVQGDPNAPRLAYLATCPNCASMWLAPPVAWSAWTFGDRGWWMVPALALAASTAAGLVAKWQEA